jgi:agmatinase
MFSTLITLLALTGLAASSSVAQRPLKDQDPHSNFIQSSIFSRESFDISSLNDPVILAPTFEYKSSESLFDGLGTFAHLDFVDCTKSENSASFDIGIVGHPFDLGVSYRPGARFGPNGARQGARRLSPVAGWE